MFTFLTQLKKLITGVNDGDMDLDKMCSGVHVKDLHHANQNKTSPSIRLTNATKLIQHFKTIPVQP